jgi:biopolymer transport protein ExbD
MRMPTPARVWVSLFLICAGIVLFPTYRHWFATRTWVAVDTPISLARGHVRVDNFSVDLNAVFYLEIKLKGYDYYDPACQEYEVIQTRWWLSRDGRVTSTSKDFWNSHGVAIADSLMSGPDLGAFNGATGRYNLDLEFASDAGCLQRFHPHLRVYADDTDYAGGGWIFATVLLASWLLVGAGGGLLLVSWTTPLPVEVSRGESLAIFDTLLLARRDSSRRRLLLMGPASTLPTVAYFYATTFFLLVLVVAPFQLGRFPRSHGIPARLLRADVIQATMDQPTTGLLVYVDQNERLYLNSKPIAPKELRRALEKEFALRADWSVYVEADPDVAYRTVVQAMDLVRSAHGKVIILTPRTRAEAEAVRRSKSASPKTKIDKPQRTK